MNKLILACTLLAFCCTGNLNAQLDAGFIAHLSRNNLQREHLAYLSHSRQSDSLSYHFAKYYLQYPDDSLFFAYFSQSTHLFYADSSALSFAGIHFLDSPRRALWFDTMLPKLPATSRATSDAAYIHRSVLEPWNVDPENLPGRLQQDFLHYQKATAKKPAVSLALSALVPGLGKLYIGNRRSFGLTLLSMTVLGLQSYESYRKVGIQHPLTIINLGFFTTYYVVNLFGSYRETKQKAKEYKTQYLIDAATYYRYKYHPVLY